VSAAYDGGQVVGIDLHRRRSVVCRTDAHGEVLEAVRIANDPKLLAEVMGRAGEHPEVNCPGSDGDLGGCGYATSLDCSSCR
jgi:hypothetical protein